MFGHRGLWQDGWKAVAWHPSGQPFDADRWELYHLDADFAENHDLAAAQPERLQPPAWSLWWQEAERNQVLPLDDRFGPRFAANGRRRRATRQFVFHAGMGHLPTDVAPDVRSRTTASRPRSTLPAGGAERRAGRPWRRHLGLQPVPAGRAPGARPQRRWPAPAAALARPVPPARRRLAVAVTLGPWRPREGPGGARLLQPEQRVAALEVDGVEVARAPLAHGFATLISWSGLDIGLDRGSPVSHYDAPYGFTGTLRCVRYTLGPMFSPDDDARARAELARQ
jgi:hypothetical protein